MDKHCESCTDRDVACCRPMKLSCNSPRDSGVESNGERSTSRTGGCCRPLERLCESPRDGGVKSKDERSTSRTGTCCRPLEGLCNLPRDCSVEWNADWSTSWLISCCCLWVSDSRCDRDAWSMSGDSCWPPEGKPDSAGNSGEWLRNCWGSCKWVCGRTGDSVCEPPRHYELHVLEPSDDNLSI